jgi:hypothetical protein
MLGSSLVGFGLLAGVCSAALLPRSDLNRCPGYKASNVKTSATGLTADLKLAGPPCNTYGTDLEKLRLQVTYETGECRDRMMKTSEVLLSNANHGMMRREPPPCKDPGR